MKLRLELIVFLMSLIEAGPNTDTCAEIFSEFKLPRPNVHCPQNISQNVSSLSSCFEFQTLVDKNIYDLHECFEEIDQVLNKLNITNSNSRDSCFVYACSSLTEKKNDFILCISEYMLKEFLIQRRLNIPQPFLSICQEDVEDCIDEFIEICLIQQNWNLFIQTCFNLLFSLCNPQALSPQDITACKDFIENIIDKTTEEICESITSEIACDNLLESLFVNPLQLNSLNRFSFALRGISRNPKDVQSLLNETTNVFEYLTANISTVSSIFDQSDAKVLMTVMDNTMNSSHIDVLENLSMTDVGPQILSNLNKLNRICGRSILTKEGRISGNFSYHGTNLDVQFHIPYENGIENEFSYENKVIAILPYSYVCGNNSINKNMSRQMKRIVGPREKRENDDDNEEEEDLDDQFKDCFPVSFPPGCSSIVATSVTQNVDQVFPAGNRTIASVILTAEIISNRSDTNKNQRYGNITLSFTLDLIIRQFREIGVAQLNISTVKVLCSFWDVNNSDWSEDGVITRIVSDTVVECISTHLSSFAVLVDHQGVLDMISDEEAFALNVVGYVGPCVSIVCLIITIILLIILRKHLKKGPLLYIHINLSLALLLALLLLVTSIETASSITWLCSVIAGLLHYLFLCVFCWMLAEGIMLYILIVRVYGTLANKWYLLLPLGWVFSGLSFLGLPIIVVAVSAGIRPHLYGTSTTCWLSFSHGMMWSFLGPMVAIILVNTVFLVLTLYHIIHGRLHGGAEDNLKRTDLVKSIIKVTIVLLPLLGITWIIGIFALNVKTSVFLWIFTLLNSFQGVAILYFHVLRNEFVMNWFKKQITCIRKKLKKNDSSFVNKVITLQTDHDSSYKTSALNAWVEQTMAEAEGESCNDTSQCVIVMRHGARLDTADPSWERTTDRPYDTPITGKGKIEAYKVASKRCAGRDIKKVISSPFLRCLQTAQAVCNATSIKGIITNNSLCEIMTPGAKMKSAPIVPAQDIDSYDITVLEYDHHPLPNYPETLNEALERYQVAIKSIADEHYPDNLILVTHQYGVEQALTVGLGLEHSLMYEVVYCGSIELVREERDGPWRVVSKDRIYQYDNVM